MPPHRHTKLEARAVRVGTFLGRIMRTPYRVGRRFRLNGLSAVITGIVPGSEESQELSYHIRVEGFHGRIETHGTMSHEEIRGHIDARRAAS
jgi:hypothetical protein